MWRLHRYYLKELVINFAITFLVMFAIVLVSLVTRGINRSQGGDLSDAFLITLLWALDALPHLLTIAFLLATVLTYSRAAQSRELTALRAAGIGPRAAMMPAVLVGLLLTVFASFANHYVIPDVHYHKYRVIADVLRNVILNLRLDSDRIPVLDTGFVMTFKSRDGYRFVDCTIYCPQGKRLAPQVISPIMRVDEVVVRIEEEARSLAMCCSGVRDPVPNREASGSYSDINLLLSMDEIANQGRRADEENDLRSDQLLGEVMRGVHPDPSLAVYVLFRRCCFSLMPALLAPIGFCIAEWMRFRGRILALVAALVPLTMFYAGEVIGARLQDESGNPWAAWLPAVLLLAVGLPLCWRQLRR
jgi:lipopolysaccharide export LptBFGC system permease protein LptF